MRAFSPLVVVAAVFCGVCSGFFCRAAHADRDDNPHKGAAYRLGAAASKIALMPVKCGRDIEPELCASIDESLAVDLGRDPRIDIVTPRDLEVLLGAQQLVELSSCEGEEACFDASSFTQLEASYLVSVAIGRIGGDAQITVRLVDLKRGVVIDRDDAKAWRGSEAAIDEATRALARAILVRRGVATPPQPVSEDGGGSPVVFWGGVGAGVLGVAGAAAGGFFGLTAYTEAQSLKLSSGLSQQTFDNVAKDAQQNALIADVALGVSGALVVGGVTLMVLGSF